ncbi:MAG: hypothetical protein ACJAWV_002297 [Flammeovirgaceae bacterium]
MVGRLLVLTELEFGNKCGEMEAIEGINAVFLANQMKRP